MADQIDPDCEDFFLYLSSVDAVRGNPSNFSINLPAPRSLQGRWRMAMKEITYTQSNKDRAFADNDQFIVFARQEHTQEFEEYIRRIQNEQIAEVNFMYNSEKIPSIPNAAVITFNNQSGKRSSGPMTSPSGQFASADDFIRAVNANYQTLYNDWQFHEAPFFYLVDKGEAHKKVVCSWNYPRGLWRKVALMPIIGLRNRRLLSIPGLESPKMFRLLAMALNGSDQYPDTEFGDEGFTQGQDNMFVLCDLVRTTGARVAMEGKILRAIPNAQKPDGTIVHLDFSEDYFEVTPKSSFFTIHLRIVSTRNYRDLNLSEPTSVTLHFKPINKCQPIPRRVIV